MTPAIDIPKRRKPNEDLISCSFFIYDLDVYRYIKEITRNIKPVPNLKSNPKKLVELDMENIEDKRIDDRINSNPESTTTLGNTRFPFKTSFISSRDSTKDAKKPKDRDIEYSVKSHGKGIIDIGIKSRDR